MDIREIPVSRLRAAVCELYARACTDLPREMETLLENARAVETVPHARVFLDQIIENARIAREEKQPICQDTGMAVVFLDIGQDVHFVGGDVGQAVCDGVGDAVRAVPLRASTLHPLTREPLADNLPPVVHVRLMPGDRVCVHVAPKGFGCENKSRLRMLTPAQGERAVEEFIVEAVRQAGGSPCPPGILGVGIGGTMETAALLAKRALLRTGQNPEPVYAALEEKLLAAVNALGIGPMGLGGRTTMVAVYVEGSATHIAGFPVAVNFQCHAARAAECVL